MTGFVPQAHKTDGIYIFDEDWNVAVVDNTQALYERLPVFYPYKRVANTTTQIELYRHTIPANALGPNGSIMTELSGVLQNAAGSTATPILTWYLDGVSLFGCSSPIATSAYRIPIFSTLRLQNMNNASAQIGTRQHAYGGTPSPSGTLISLSYNGAWAEFAVDTTVSHDLIVKWQWDILHASCIFDLLSAHVIGPIYRA